MSAQDVAALLTPLAWPITLVGLVVAFRKPMQTFLRRLSESLTIKSLKVTALGGEIELTPEQAKSILDELLQEITDPTNELSEPEIKLFQAILAASGSRSVEELLPGFRRESEQHLQLRALRERVLVRPQEGGKWEATKHPIVTRFGKLLADLKANAMHPK